MSNITVYMKKQIVVFTDFLLEKKSVILKYYNFRQIIETSNFRQNNSAFT